MFRHLYFCTILLVLASMTTFSQDSSTVSSSKADDAIEAILKTTVEDFTRGFIVGFNDSVALQITAFEERMDARTDLTARQKVFAKEDFRKSMMAIMGGVRDRTLKELKIAEVFRAKLVEFYKANFSESELIELGEFYSTPLGKKVVQNQSKLQRFVQDFSKTLLDERFFRIVDEETKKNLTPQVKAY